MTDDDDIKQNLNGNGSQELVTPQDYEYNQPFHFLHGGSIPRLNIRYETYGKLNADKSNAILICHALTGNHHVAGRNKPDDAMPGWWDHFVGPNKPIDTNKYFVICNNCLGGCSGTTGPASINPETGDPYGLDFPVFTFEDMVKAQKLLIEHLGIEQLHAVVGGSMGGMQALLWAVNYPDSAKNIITMACPAKQNTQAMAFNCVARAAIFEDPGWKEGYYAEQEGRGPTVGLAVARMMAHITYLSDFSLEKKTHRPADPLPGDTETAKFKRAITPPIWSYLRHQGEKFLGRFDANCYLYISAATDFFNIAGNQTLVEAFAPVKARVLSIGFSTDWLYPSWQNREITIALNSAGKESYYAEIEAANGHDSFLLRSDHLNETVSRFLAGEAI